MAKALANQAKKETVVKWIWMAIVFCILLLVITLAVKVGTADLNYSSVAKVQIDAEEDVVFQKIGNLYAWPEWSPFIPANAPDIQIDQTTSPPTMTWADPRGGQSELTLDRMDAVGGELTHTLNSKLFPPMKGKFNIIEIDSDTVEVTWSVDGSLPNSFFYALAAGNYGEMMGSQLEQSLQRLKTVCEKEGKEELTETTGNPTNRIPNE